MYGGGSGGGRPAAAVGIGGTAGTVGLSYADSVRSRTPFEVMGRPLRSNHHQHFHHHHQHQIQQQPQQYEGSSVVDTLRPADDVNATVNRLRSLQAHLESRDNALNGPANNELQLIAHKDKVCDFHFLRHDAIA